MLHLIVRFCEPMLRFLWPVQGRHRSPAATPDACRDPAVPAHLYARPFAAHRRAEVVVKGEDIPLVRPNLLGYEGQQAREEAELRRARRRALWLAVHGVDIGPRLIHGVRVVA